MRLFIYSRPLYSKSDAKADLTRKLAVVQEKFKKFFKFTIAKVKWHEISPSKYECEKDNGKWICSIITKKIKIKYIKHHSHAPKNFQDQCVRFIEKYFCKHKREHSIHKGAF
jgi:hypothetical protein